MGPARVRAVRVVTSAGTAGPGRPPTWWRRVAAWCAAGLRGRVADPLGRPLPRAVVRRYGEYTALQFVRGQTQSRMRTRDPDHLLIDYTRTMLGCLLFRPRPALIGMVGLGGGSQAKFCHRHLAARVEVVENHPGVIALRREFGIPDDDARLAIVHDDGARFVAGRRAAFDLLLVDGYDAAGIPPELSTQAFYDDCREALRPDGALATNLYCDDADAHVARLRRSFGADHVAVVGEARMSNRVAFAWRGETPPATAVDAALADLPGSVRDELAPVLRRVAAALPAPRG